MKRCGEFCAGKFCTGSAICLLCENFNSCVKNNCKTCDRRCEIRGMIYGFFVRSGDVSFALCVLLTCFSLKFMDIFCGGRVF